MAVTINFVAKADIKKFISQVLNKKVLNKKVLNKKTAEKKGDIF